LGGQCAVIVVTQPRLEDITQNIQGVAVAVGVQKVRKCRYYMRPCAIEVKIGNEKGV